MNGQRAMVVVLLIASLFVLGSLSASLEATVSSTPDDVIDVDTESLPFAGDGASEIADSYRSAEEGDQGEVANANGGDQSRAGDSDSNGDSVGGQGGEDGPTGNDGPDGDREGGAGGQGQAGAGGGESGQSGGAGEGDSGDGPGEGPGDGYAESLWDTIAQYVVLALALLAILALVAIGRALARRREQLRARLRALAERYGLLADGTDDVAVPDGEGEAGTVVERAWAEMLAESAASPSPGDTPRECADAVIAAGGEPAAVEELTGMYERVRYGDGSVTAAEASEALEHARAIGPAHGPGSIEVGRASVTGTDGEEGHP